MKGIVVEGVVASGKSTLLTAVQGAVLRIVPNVSKIYISEHYTERALGRTAGVAPAGCAVRAHLDRVVQSLGIYHELYCGSPFRTPYHRPTLLVTLERFALTHLANLPEGEAYGVDEACEHLRCLSNMGLRQIILYLPVALLRDRIMSTLQHRNAQWRDYLLAKGNEQQIVEYYARWQSRLLGFAEACGRAIETTVLDVSHASQEELTQRSLGLLLGEEAARHFARATDWPVTPAAPLRGRSLRRRGRAVDPRQIILLGLEPELKAPFGR